MTAPVCCGFRFQFLGRFLAACSLVVLLAVPCQAQQTGAPAVLGDRRAGGAGEEYLYATVATADGGYLLAGTSDSGATGDKSQPSQGQTDYWAIKFDAAGTKQWDQRFGGTDGEELATALQTADGGYLLAGTTASSGTGDMTQGSQGDADFWVVKLTAAGVRQWDRRFGGNFNDFLRTAIQTSDGGYLLGGETTSDRTGDVGQPSKGAGDGWVVKLDATGNQQWDQRLGGAQRDIFLSSVQTPDGGYLLGGVTASGATGDVSQPTRGGSDYWLVKTNAAGIKQWDRRFGGDQQDILTTVVPTTDGGFLLSGTSPSDAVGDKTQPSYGSGNTGRADYWLVKTDGAGTKQWDRRYGGTGDDVLTSVCLAPNGGFLLAGWSRSGAGADKTQPSQGRDDYWLVRVSSTGTQVWDQRLGGTEDDTDPQIIGLASGGYVLAGTSNSGATGNKTQPSQGLHDFWAVRLGAELLATTPTAPEWGRSVGVYPNPAHASGTVTLPSRTAGNPPAVLTLFDVLGRVVHQQRESLRTAPVTAVVPLSALSPGIYLLQVRIGDASVVRRLEIE